MAVKQDLPVLFLPDGQGILRVTIVGWAPGAKLVALLCVIFELF
jgi:hypothetical protein